MSEIIVYGAEWCGGCKAAKHLLESLEVPYTYFDIDNDKGKKQEMLRLNGDSETIPTVVFNGRIIQEPTNQQLKEFIGVENMSEENKVVDVLMVGAGPAALTAAIYTTREDIETVLYEKGVIGGLAAITDWIDNYPGFSKGIAGLDLSEELRLQAERFGADIQLGEVTKISDIGEYKEIETTDGLIKAKSVLLATGSDYRKLGIPGEEEYYARGVHYCATCDGAFYRDKRLVVVGGGNSAVQEAIFLTKFATKIDLLVRGENLRASEVLQHELDKHKDKITVHFNTSSKEIAGEDKKVVKVVAQNTKENKEIIFETDGVFIFIGLLPNTDFLKESDVKLDEVGMILTDQKLETSMKGVFAAGDVRSGATMQIASAAGEGATAAMMIRKYLEPHHQ